jgi:hypothetical protein
MLRYTIVLSVLVASMSPALAQAPTAAERAACAADQKKFCVDVKPGGGRILDCLFQHADQLTPSCRSVLDAHEKGK